MISKPKILLIYTGGTIGMIQSENGTYAPFSLKSLIDFVPQVDCLGIEILLESFDKPLDLSLIHI